MASFKILDPAQYFSGRKLEIARAMDAENMGEVRRLAQGVDLSTPGKEDLTLMWYAMQPARPNFEAVKTLVALGVDPDTQMAQGIGSALESTFIPRKDPNDKSSVRFLEAMLNGGMSPNKATKYGTTLLQRAAGGADTLEQVKLLIARGANANSRDGIGQTALDEAIDADNPKIAIYLVNHGADVKNVDRLGTTPAWGVFFTLKRMRPNPTRTEFEKLRDLMIEKGVKWPPDSPEVVRDQMRAKGLEPVVPVGHTR